MTLKTLEDVCVLIVDSEHKTAPKDPDGLHPLIRTTDLGCARGNFSDAQRSAKVISSPSSFSSPERA